MEGRVLHDSLPCDPSVSDDNREPASVLSDFYGRVAHLGALTTTYLTRCAQEDAAFQRDIATSLVPLSKDCFVGQAEHAQPLARLFREWREVFLQHWEMMHEVQTRVIPNQPDPLTGKPRKLRTTMGTSVFCEITRLFYLVERPLVEFEARTMRLGDLISNSLWVARAAGRFSQSTWAERCIITQYSQLECVTLTLYLTELTHDTTEATMDLFRQLYEALWYRVAFLQSRGWPVDSGVLDMEYFYTQQALRVCNREFYTFCSFYLGDLMRRFYYYDLLLRAESNPPAGADSIQQLLTKIIHDLPEEAFVDSYILNCDHAYNFSEDDRWFKFRYPLKVHTRSECLYQLRRHLYDQYHSEERTSKEACLAKMHTSYASRSFVLKVFNGYVHARTGNASIDWYGRAVIFSNQIHKAHYELMTNESPHLLQVQNNFWAYDQRTVFITDNVYEAMAHWFWLLHTRYRDAFYAHSFAAFVAEALPNLKRNEEEEEEAELDAVFGIETPAAAAAVVEGLDTLYL